MIKEHFLPLDFTIKLRELGFNDPCISFYDMHGVFHFSDDFQQINENTVYPTPTWFQALSWLEREFDMILVIDWFENYEYGYTIKNIDTHTRIVSRVLGISDFDRAKFLGVKALINRLLNE